MRDGGSAPAQLLELFDVVDMMTPGEVKRPETEDEFNKLVKFAGARTVVVDFFAVRPALHPRAPRRARLRAPLQRQGRPRHDLDLATRAPRRPRRSRALTARGAADVVRPVQGDRAGVRGHGG